MVRLGAAVSIAMMLSACAGSGPGTGVVDGNSWLASKYKDQMPSLFESGPKPREADPRPDVKAIVRSDLTAVFGRTEVRNVNVGPARPNGYNWQACLRAEVSGVTKADLGVKYFMVDIDRGRVGLRRPAAAADKCETDPYEAI